MDETVSVKDKYHLQADSVDTSSVGMFSVDNLIELSVDGKIELSLDDETYKPSSLVLTDIYGDVVTNCKVNGQKYNDFINSSDQTLDKLVIEFTDDKPVELDIKYLIKGITIDADGISANVVTSSKDYKQTVPDSLIVFNDLKTNCLLELLDAVCYKGKQITIVNKTDFVVKFTEKVNGDDLELNGKYTNITIISDGTEWIKLG